MTSTAAFPYELFPDLFTVPCKGNDRSCLLVTVDLSSHTALDISSYDIALANGWQITIHTHTLTVDQLTRTKPM